MKHFIISGGSRGIGKSMAEALAMRGDRVSVIARTALELKGVNSFKADLSEPLSIAKTMDELFSHIESAGGEAITSSYLINNAGMVGPIAHLNQLPPSEMIASLNVNLASPMLLTSEFLKRTEGEKRCITNVSSGVAKTPLNGWETYSAAKAGLENFSQALLNQFETDERTRVVCFNPGVVDTDMQGNIRSSSSDSFPMVDKFIDLKKEGALRSPAVVAKALIDFLDAPGGERLSRGFVSINDLL